MSSIAVVTDSNSGITKEEARERGIHILPMPFFINEKQYYEDIDLKQDEFFAFIEQGAEVSTSQPSPGDLIDFWDSILKEYNEIVYIPMSSGLSASCESAYALAQEYRGRIQVVNNQRISLTQRDSVIDAVELVKFGKSAGEIKEILEREKLNSTIYIMVDTLKYLKKGGRVTPAGAMLGTVLNLKPVLTIQGEKLDAYAKVRGHKQAVKTMIEALHHDFKNRFSDEFAAGTMTLNVAYTGKRERAEKFARELQEEFGIKDVITAPLALSIACHIGPGALACAASRKIPELIEAGISY